MKIILNSLIILILSNTLLIGQNKPFVTLTEQLNDPKYAEWITMPEIQGSEYGVYYFRKVISIKNVPEKFIVHVSADNRYRLFVNGEMVSWGPAVGDIYNWYYETIDIADKLHSGQNIIAAQVWNFGPYSGSRQISNRTAFILQGNSSFEHLLNTNNSWKVEKDQGYFPIAHSAEQVGGGYIAGATDSLVAIKHTWGWNNLEFDDIKWKYGQELGKGNHRGLNTWHGTPWMLKPRSIPAMEQVQEATPVVLQIKGMDIQPESLSKAFDFSVPKSSKVTLLLDNKQLTMGFPHIYVSRGKGATIRIRYQESLFDRNNLKGNRNEWQGKTMKGYYDVFVSDGEANRVFVPLWLRVFRYVQIEIETQNEALFVHDFKNVFTAYPFEQKASFTCDDPVIEKIWDVSWRTVRLCALETYMDCPYYEQLQYIGDTRIQALISMYVTGDDRLVRNAIDQFYNSLQPMGLTKSNHPFDGVQIIPPFTLIYINMLHDYFMLRDDAEFIQNYLPGVRFMLDWFISRIDESNMLGPLPYWNHIDGGTKEFIAGSPPGIEEGGSAHMSILLAYALNHATVMFSYFGYQRDAQVYKEISDRLINSTLALCYDAEKGLIAETPQKQLFSQHTNAMAILAGAFTSEQVKPVAQKIIEDKDLAQATLYFNFYVFQALKQAGLGGEIFNQLSLWEEFLDFGFTTFPEHGINSRSDCHAWSSHPMYDFLNITCGISSASQGFKKLRIEPQLGKFSIIEGQLHHPSGMISVKYTKQEDNKLKCIIEIPDKITGEIIWNGKSFPLNNGKNQYLLE